jgi:hypothetical protein
LRSVATAYVLLSFLVPGTSHSDVVDGRLREILLKSTYVVVGKVILINPHDVTTRRRTSTIVVGEVVSGLASPGDSLQVDWRTNEFIDKDGQKWFSACNQGGGTPLNSIADQPTLYILERTPNLEISHGKLICTTKPIILNDLKREYIDRITDAAMTPLPVVTESKYLSEFNSALETNAEFVANCTAFARYIENLTANEK